MPLPVPLATGLQLPIGLVTTHPHCPMLNVTTGSAAQPLSALSEWGIDWCLYYREVPAVLFPPLIVPS